jgi:hypothetical protein
MQQVCHATYGGANQQLVADCCLCRLAGTVLLTTAQTGLDWTWAELYAAARSSSDLLLLWFLLAMQHVATTILLLAEML